MRKEDFIIELFNDKGDSNEYDILSITADVETDETYVVYTDYALKDNDDFKLYVSRLVENDNHYSLAEVDDYDRIPNLKLAVDLANRQVNVNTVEEGGLSE